MGDESHTQAMPKSRRAFQVRVEQLEDSIQEKIKRTSPTDHYANSYRIMGLLKL